MTKEAEFTDTRSRELRLPRISLNILSEARLKSPLRVFGNSHLIQRISVASDFFKLPGGHTGYFFKL